MFEPEELLDRLNDALEALERIPYRFESIKAPEDFMMAANIWTASA